MSAEVISRPWLKTLRDPTGKDWVPHRKVRPSVWL